LGADPQIIDCLEFNAEFRTLDPVDELAFFAIEGESLDVPEIGTIVLARYRTETGDNPSPQLVEFYKCCRAAIEAVHLASPGAASPRSRTLGEASPSVS
jgi:aminoglycoside phosphotransferase family enzyme